MLVRLKKRPTGVMRGSFLILKMGPCASLCSRSAALRFSASTYMDRNL